MLMLTDRAVDKVKEFMAQQEDTYAGVRVRVVAGGCSGFEYRLHLEKAQNDGDEVLDQNGVKVFVDPQSFLYLEGTKVDFVESNTGSGFSFQNPNVTGSCGCGESVKF